MNLSISSQQVSIVESMSLRRRVTSPVRAAIALPEGRTQAGFLPRNMATLRQYAATNLRRERQMEGIAAAKAKGVYKGRLRRLKLRAWLR